MGVQKLLLPFDGRTVIGHITEEVRRSLVARTVVVVGQDADRIAGAVAGHRVTVVTNPDLGGDMLSSVRCGLRAMPSDCEAVLVALGDQPAITADLIDRMVQAYRTAERGILVPVYGGRRGHPLLFTSRYRDEILTAYDGIGLRGLLRAHADDVFEFDVPSSSILEDMDHPDDHRRALAKFSRKRDRPAPPL